MTTYRHRSPLYTVPLRNEEYHNYLLHLPICHLALIALANAWVRERICAQNKIAYGDHCRQTITYLIGGYVLPRRIFDQPYISLLQHRSRSMVIVEHELCDGQVVWYGRKGASWTVDLSHVCDERYGSTVAYPTVFTMFI